MLSFIHGNEEFVWWMALASIVAFFSTLLLVPLILIRLPSDYFSHRRRSEIRARSRHPLARAFLALVQNAVALVFIVTGIAMLVLPGQGILTIVVGLMLLNFPGKYHAEQWVVGHESVLGAINWIRARADKSPLAVNFDEKPER
jgi:archaellum biogenesis protein FlaJ (TadC family)